MPKSFEKSCELEAAYRLLENPDVAYGAVIASHIARVRQELGRPGHYLLVEDSTELNYSSQPAAQDLGLIGDGSGRGRFVHSRA